MKKKNKRAMVAYYSDTLYNVFRNKDIASFIPMDRKVQKLVVSIEPVQSGTGVPSPDNVRPITGFTGCNVTRTGNNLLNTKTIAPTTLSSGGISITQNANGTFAATGIATSIVNLWLRGTWGASDTVLRLYSGVTYFIKDVMLYRGTTQLTVTIYIGSTGIYTPTTDIEITGVRASCPVDTDLTGVTIEPYITHSDNHIWSEFGDIYSISWNNEAGTVYGGMLDVTTGKFTITKSIMVFDGSSDENWVLDNQYVNRFVINTGNLNTGNYNNFISNYLLSTLWGVNLYSFGLRSDGKLYLTLDNTDTQMTLAEYKTYLTNNPLQIVYELSVPQTYQLTPTQISTIVGNWNNIWCDTGEIIELVV